MKLGTGVGAFGHLSSGSGCFDAVLARDGPVGNGEVASWFTL